MRFEDITLLMQHVIGKRGGVIEDISMHPKFPHGSHYLVKPLPKLKRGKAVLIVAKRRWFKHHENGHEIEFIVKRIKKIDVS